MKLLLQNTRIISPGQDVDRVADILIVDGVIEKIGTGLKAPAGCETKSLNGVVASPGFVDMHVHLREPGYEHKETIESGCRSAAAGGFTAVCCMPNTKPAIDEESVVTTIIRRSREVLGGLVDVYPVAAATKGREGKELSPMMELFAAGAVGFTDDGAPILDPEIMRRVLEYSSMTGAPVIQHAEETSMTKGGAMNEGLVSTRLGIQAMPSVAEDLIVARDVGLVEYAGGRYHVAHLSTAGAAGIVRQAKAKGLPVTAEVTPHHFVLTDDAVRTYDTNTKMNPPLRTGNDVNALKEALADGTIDVIASDHAPHSYDEKQVEFIHAPFGIVGLETSIGLSLTHLVHEKVLSLRQLIEKCSDNPRRILKLPSAVISEGARACITLFDPDASWRVETSQFLSKSKNSPFQGFELKGKPVGIVNNGSFYFN